MFLATPTTSRASRSGSTAVVRRGVHAPSITPSRTIAIWASRIPRSVRGAVQIFRSSAARSRIRRVSSGRRQVEERLLERRALGDELVQDDALRGGDLPHPGGCRVRNREQVALGRRDLDACLLERGTKLLGLRAPHPDAAGRPRHQFGGRRLLDELAAVDDHDLVDDLLELGEDVAGEEDRPPLRGQRAKELAEPADPLRVEPVRRLVENEHLRVAEQRAGEAQALAHAERVAAGAPSGRFLEIDELQHLLDSRAGKPVAVASTRR